MAKSWLVDCRAIAKKVRNATLSSVASIKDCGAKRECPNCHYLIDNSDVAYEWPGLPVGVKFDPSDVELLDHLAAKCGVGDAQPHKFIDEFIPTLHTEKGICYTHPKHLPGASKDGTSIHFFHKTANAYASGQRKRRKIQTQQNEEEVRWHKTGKTKAIFDNGGVQKGCKKIMVLYRSSHKGSKPVKSNWVMHQYHLGAEEDEREGEFVVSKIFYQQQKQNEKTGDSLAVEEPNLVGIQHGPKTPTPNPPRAGSSFLCEDAPDDNMLSSTKENLDPEDTTGGSCFPPTCSQYQENVHKQPVEYPAGESQAVDATNPADIDDALLCKEIFSSCASLDNDINFTDVGYIGSYSIADLENINLDTLPDFQHADLQFGSQEDSVLSWLDRL